MCFNYWKRNWLGTCDDLIHTIAHTEIMRKKRIFFWSWLNHWYSDHITRNPINSARPDGWPIKGVGISQQKFFRSRNSNSRSLIKGPNVKPFDQPTLVEKKEYNLWKKEHDKYPVKTYMVNNNVTWYTFMFTSTKKTYNFIYTFGFYINLKSFRVCLE